MKKHYIYFTRKLSLQPGTAHKIHDVLCANAAANLGYSTVLIYLQESSSESSLLSLISPFNPRSPSEKFKEFYNTQDKLQLLSSPQASSFPLLLQGVLGMNR